MNPVMVKFYEDRHKSLSLMVEKKPPRVTPVQVVEAAEEFYSKIAEQNPKGIILKDGRTVKNIDIAREVFEIAKGYTNNTKQFEKDLDVFQNGKKIIAKLKQDIAGLQETISIAQEARAETSQERDGLLKQRKRGGVFAVVVAVSTWAYLAYTHYEDIWEAIKCLIPM